MTGYPSIDKPWLKYYSEEAINAPLPECTIYEYLWGQNKDFLEDVAIVYLGRKIFYKELFANIDRAADSFWSLGVAHRDKKNGQLAKAFITLKPEYKGKDETVLKELEQLLLKKLPERDTVEAYRIIEELPLTPIGKVDYRALEQWRGEKR